MAADDGEEEVEVVVVKPIVVHGVITVPLVFVASKQCHGHTDLLLFDGSDELRLLSLGWS
jgi:hypothetical protein